jgi:predicted 2-oxoglutarate/Fe(II)-dependent dioxygenase YbiX
MIEEIKLNDNTSIYKTKIEISDIDKLISDIKLNLDVDLETKKSTSAEPGIQSTIVISSTSIRELNEKIIKVLFENSKIDKNTPYTTKQWVYISDKKNTYYGFHSHDKKNHTNIPLQLTYTYYVQMPNNLVGDDGKLVFKLENGTTYSILPEVGDLLIFPTTLLHAPMTNTNSEIERIVFAGVWSYIDDTIQIRKKNKTIL